MSTPIFQERPVFDFRNKQLFADVVGHFFELTHDRVLVLEDASGFPSGVYPCTGAPGRPN